MESAIKASAERKAHYFFRLSENIRKNYELYLLILPAMIYFIVFHYLPIYGVQIAFRNYIPGKDFFECAWVGLENFTRFFNSFSFWPILSNTISISLLSLLLGFPFPIILAIMLNELRSTTLKKSLQTISYAPHFISTVAMVGIILVFLSERGVVNNIIALLGGDRISFMSKPEYFVWIYVIAGIWQHSGWGSIIYIASLSSVDTELYEAAIIDGATKMQRVRYIDIPSIRPTMVIMLILRSGSILSVGYEQVLLLQNPLNLPASQIISTYVYQIGIQGADYSYSAAIGLFNSIVNLIMLVSMNAVSRKVSETSLW